MPLTVLLWQAAHYGHSSVVQLLLELGGANVNATDHSGWTALMDAAESGHVGAVTLLLRAPGIDVQAADKSGWTALMHADLHNKTQGHSQAMSLLRDAMAGGFPRLTSVSPATRLPSPKECKSPRASKRIALKSAASAVAASDAVAHLQQKPMRMVSSDTDSTTTEIGRFMVACSDGQGPSMPPKLPAETRRTVPAVD